MAIQTGEGPVRIDADDAKFKHRGKTIALKMRVIMWPVMMGYELQGDGSWEAGVDLTDDLFASDPPGGGDAVAYWVAHHGGPMGFVRTVVRPRLQAWLDTVWPPISGPGDLPPSGEAEQQLAAALGSVRFVAMPNGTVVASM